MVIRCLAAAFVLGVVGGCSETPPLIQGSKAPAVLPGAWFESSSHTPQVRIDAAGKVAVIPTDTAGYWRVNPERMTPSPEAIAIADAVTPEAVVLIPPYDRTLPVRAEEFVAIDTPTLSLSGWPVDPRHPYNFAGAAPVVHTSQDFAHLLLHDGTKITSGFASFKAVSLSPDWKYAAACCSDKPIKHVTMLFIYRDEEFPGEEYLQVIDPKSGKPLGHAVRLEQKKGTPARSTLLWSPDSKLLIVHDSDRLLNVFAIEELLFATQNPEESKP
ncbi:hypothetical protein BH11PLA1_BH11PLA1_22310 [soil metagenome]